MIPGMSEDLPARRFGWSDMFVHPDDDPRTDGGFKGERATLVGFLRDQRLTLELKCSGLDAADLARRSVEPSNLSLLGLVRHMAEVERAWFRRRLAGQDAPPHYAGPDADFEGAVPDPEVVAQAWANWRAEVAFAERFVAEAPRSRPRRHGGAPPARGAGAHDRGVRPAQRPRRLPARADRRTGGPVTG